MYEYFYTYLSTILFCNVFAALTWDIITNLALYWITLFFWYGLTLLFRNLFTLRSLHLIQKTACLETISIISIYSNMKTTYFSNKNYYVHSNNYRGAFLSWYVLALLSFNRQTFLWWNFLTFLFWNVVATLSWNLKEQNNK